MVRPVETFEGRKPTPMTNIELLQKISEARGLAHRAPFAEWSKDHRGHSAIVHHTSAWADKSNEFFELMAEADRRGLKMPPCDCPEGDHESTAHIKRGED